MKNRGLLILSILVVLVVGYSIYDYQSEKIEEKQKSESSQLLKMEKDQVNEFEITRSNTEKIKLLRDADGWKIKEPIQENADQNAAQDFVDATILEKYKSLIKEGADIDLKVFGLDEPRAYITFKDNAGHVAQFEVSKTKNYEGDSYLRRDQENKVYLVSSTWMARADKKVFDFQDKRMMKLPAAGIKSIKIKKGSDTLFFEKNENNWTNIFDKSMKLNQSKVSEIGYNLNNVSATEYLNEKDMKKLGLTKPLVQIQVVLKGSSVAKGNQIWTSDIGINDKKEYFVKSSDGYIFKIATADFEKFLKLDLSDLRDKNEPFHYDKDQVKKIFITTPEVQAQFNLESDKWVPTEPSKGFKPEMIKEVLSQIKNSELTDFKAHIKQSQFEAEAKKTRILFKDQDDKVVFQFDYATTYTKKVDGMDKKLIYAKTNLYPFIFGIEEDKLKAMKITELLNIKEPAKEK